MGTHEDLEIYLYLPYDKLDPGTVNIITKRNIAFEQRFVIFGRIRKVLNAKQQFD